MLASPRGFHGQSFGAMSTFYTNLADEPVTPTNSRKGVG
jgi:hypothetical protein